MKNTKKTTRFFKYRTKKLCSKCGFIFPIKKLSCTHQSMFGHKESIVEVEEKIADVVAVLISKGYNVCLTSCKQGGWPDYYEDITPDGEIAEISNIIDNSIKSKEPKRFMLKFRMSPLSVRKIRKDMTDEAIQIYSENYWNWVGEMITTLPNAFNISAVNDHNTDTLPRAMIRNPKAKARDIVVTWIPELSLSKLETEEEFITMANYSYKKLKEWADKLPDINKYMLDKLK